MNRRNVFFCFCFWRIYFICFFFCLKWIWNWSICMNLPKPWLPSFNHFLLMPIYFCCGIIKTTSNFWLYLTEKNKNYLNKDHNSWYIIIRVYLLYNCDSIWILNLNNTKKKTKYFLIFVTLCADELKQFKSCLNIKFIKI